jgi:hypothetical protein
MNSANSRVNVGFASRQGNGYGLPLAPIVPGPRYKR